MNIDDTQWIGFHKERFYDLHIASENQEIGLVFYECHDAALICLARLTMYRKMVVWDVIHTSQWFQVRMVTDDKGNVHGQFTAAPAPEEIYQAMVEFGDKYADSLGLPGVMDTPLHMKFICYRVKCILQLCFI